MRILAVLLCVGLAGCTSFGTVRESALHITIDDSSCSATVVGPHAILSAAHCFDWPYHLTIYGQPVAVKSAMLDGNDHIILIVESVTFSRWVERGNLPKMGESVTILGNPGDMTQQFRHGYVAGQMASPRGLADMFDLRIWFGDSGAGIFDSHNDLVGVVSFIYTQDDGHSQLAMAGAFPLAFTDAQWAEAGR